MKQFLRKLFCKHNYVKTSWYQEEDRYRNERYAIRIYQCAKCGKRMHIDGRRDAFKNSV